MIDDARDRIEKLRSLQEFSFKEQQYERGNGGMFLLMIATLGDCLESEICV